MGMKTSEREELRSKQLREDPKFAADVAEKARQKEITATAQKGLDIKKEKERIKEGEKPLPTGTPGTDIIPGKTQISKEEGEAGLEGRPGYGERKDVMAFLKTPESIKAQETLDKSAQTLGIAIPSLMGGVGIGAAAGVGVATGAGIAAFTSTLGIQVMQFWASVDNVAGLASLDAHHLMSVASFSDVSNEEIQASMDRIDNQLNFAENSAQSAAWINPATGWALSKFYKRAIEETKLSIADKWIWIKDIRKMG